MTQKELREFLDDKASQYNQINFIETDPIQIPHQFSDAENIAIAGFLTATLAWGQRKTIINSANKLMHIMGNSPHDFVLCASDKQISRLAAFKHRTFNGYDAMYMTHAIRSLYKIHNSMEDAFSTGIRSNDTDLRHSITNFRSILLGAEASRTHKHVSDPSRGSAAKRINMFLRWMCRKDRNGVDFGIWNISPELLSCPLDVHSGTVARKLGLLTRKQNDWKAVTELDISLRKLDPSDPVKYDFALFGLGAFEKF